MEAASTGTIWEYTSLTAQPETLYGAADLTHLEGLDAVRKRPGMYIGSTDSRGVGHLVNEILDNFSGQEARTMIALLSTSSFKSRRSAPTTHQEDRHVR